MPKIPLLFISSIIVSLSARCQTINFLVDLPYNNQVVNSNGLEVLVYFGSSTYQLARIEAVGGGDTVQLENSPDFPTHFYGSVNISKVPLGDTSQVYVIATDVMGNKKADTINYIHTKDPEAFILTPLPGTNAYPSLHIRTSHTGAGTCVSDLFVTLSSDTVFKISTLQDIDTVITLPGTKPRNGIVTLTVTDKWNEVGTKSVTIFTDNNPFLIPLYTSDGKILDYNYHNILETKNNSLYLVENSFQKSSVLPGSNSGSTGALTPYGAIWQTANKDAELNNGTLINQKVFFGNTAGDYVTCVKAINPSPNANHYVYRRNMLTKDSILVADIQGNGTYNQPVVAANGLVIYSSYDALGLYKYINGTKTALGLPNRQYFYPVTDGKNILFIEREADDTHSVLWHDGQTTTVITNLGNMDPSSPGNYLLSDKFVAYREPGFSGEWQIWLIDSTGAKKQLTFMGQSSYIHGLSPGGDLIYDSPDPNGGYKTWYLKYGNTVPKEIMDIQGNLIYRDSSWYVIRERYLYKLNVDALRTIASGNWSDPAVWEDNMVPPANADVIVTKNIIADIDVVCNSLHIVAPGSITVVTGKTITVLH